MVTVHECDRQTDGQTDRITIPKTKNRHSHTMGARQTGLMNCTSDFGTLGVACDRFVPGWACALLVNAQSASFTVIITSATDFTDYT